MGPLRSVLAAAGGLFVVGCSVASAGIPLGDPVGYGQETANDGGTLGSQPSGVLPILDGGLFSADAAAPAIPSDQCTEASRLVYVVARDNSLYSFAPETVAFTKVGTIACPSEQASFPFSMAVDRAGTAWVLFTDGNLFNVSTKDASCTRTTFIPDQSGFSLFGMAFVSNGADAGTDTLYVSENVNGHGLGKIAMPSLELSAVGPYTGTLSGQRAELTGTGEGDLFGFFLTTPAAVAQITTASGAVMTPSTLPTVDVGTDWAFSSWGGSFYLYTGNSTDPSQNGSAVTRFDPGDGGVTVLSAGIGFFVTGAGVSTCAPTVPPPPPTPH